ncbi:MAG: molecular chaperone DnaJ [Solirubrobacteraceae bacterium]|jgi:curved DNA-binding protein CbpA|nr:molecular chaperone DnaJ [Solirubrobacteraceae bacterium]
MSARDPYTVLGVSSAASDAEVRAAYRRAVQREHPDHNGGSPESARRFEAVQEAYALIRVQRTRDTVAGEPRRRTRAARNSQPPPPPRADAPDPGVDARLAELERQLAAARAASERARQAAREAEAAATRSRADRPSDEELGYYRTEDSFSQIISDAASELLSDVRKRDVPKRVADLIDELGSKLTGEPPQH